MGGRSPPLAARQYVTRPRDRRTAPWGDVLAEHGFGPPRQVGPTVGAVDACVPTRVGPDHTPYRARRGGQAATVLAHHRHPDVSRALSNPRRMAVRAVLRRAVGRRRRRSPRARARAHLRARYRAGCLPPEGGRTHAQAPGGQLARLRPTGRVDRHRHQRRTASTCLRASARHVARRHATRPGGARSRSERELPQGRCAQRPATTHPRATRAPRAT